MLNPYLTLEPSSKGFLDFVLELLIEALDAGPAKEARTCLMPWEGVSTIVPADKFGGSKRGDPVFMVEDPFDCLDNVARTLGTWDKTDSLTAEKTLTFLIIAFRSTRDILAGILSSSPQGLSPSDVKEKEMRKAREVCLKVV